MSHGTILVVEDHHDSRDFLAGLLRYAGYRVLEAEDGGDALQILDREQPNLIITDMYMPRIDGFEFIRRLQSRSPWASIPLMLYTATYRATRTLSRLSGVRSVLVKPADPACILETVALAL